MSLRDFKDLGDDVLFLDPHIELDRQHHDWRGTIKAGPASPRLIILCTWLGGATNKRIERYTQGYHNIWPASSVLLIRTNLADYLTRSERSLHRKLRPAHREIRKIAIDVCSDPARPKPTIDGGILLHVFSQGGTNIATQLLASMNNILRFLGRDTPLPLEQIVLDSCPGDPNLNSTYMAGAHSLPSSHRLRPLGCAVLYVLAAGIAGLEATGLKKPLAKIMRAQLNDPDTFSPAAARLYLTSRADEIVHSRHVEAHVQEAAAKGFKTKLLVFERAGHCSLVLEDEFAYWNAVVVCWERGRCSQAGQAGITNSTVISTERLSRL